MLIDTHCHLDFETFNPDREAVLARAAAAGVNQIVVPAIDLHNGRAVLELADRHQSVSAAVGVHPNSTTEWDDAWIDQLRRLAGGSGVVAIGEIGLDYYRDRAPRRVQQRALTLQLALAAELGLPVILHNREASQDLLTLLAASPLAHQAAPGVLHSFSADWSTARRALDLGFYLGFTGPVTYRKADDLRQVAARAPLDRIVVETDAPFLAPQAYRGRRNEPAYVVEVAARLAALHGLDAAAMAAHTTANAARLFSRLPTVA